MAAGSHTDGGNVPSMTAGEDPGASHTVVCASTVMKEATQDGWRLNRDSTDSMLSFTTFHYLDKTFYLLNEPILSLPSHLRPQGSVAGLLKYPIRKSLPSIRNWHEAYIFHGLDFLLFLL